MSEVGTPLGDDQEAWEAVLSREGMPRILPGQIGARVRGRNRRLHSVDSLNEIEPSPFNHALGEKGEEGLLAHPGQGDAVDSTTKLRPVEDAIEAEQ